jgi:hypothetical protein
MTTAHLEELLPDDRRSQKDGFSLTQYFSPTKMTIFAHAAMDASLFTTLSVGCMEQRMTDYLIAR